MSKATGRIIKTDSIRLEGRVQLSAAAGKTILPKGKNAVSLPSQVTCSCGAKMYLKCEYASAQPAAGQKAGQTG